MTKSQRAYLAATLAAFTAIVIIALFVNDRIVRPYIGDILAAMFLYCIARIFVKKRPPVLLPLYVFLAAVCVELAQLFDVLSLFGIGNNRVLRIVLGGTFDFADIALYFVGAAVMLVVQILETRKTNA